MHPEDRYEFKNNLSFATRFFCILGAATIIFTVLFFETNKSIETTSTEDTSITSESSRSEQIDGSEEQVEYIMDADIVSSLDKNQLMITYTNDNEETRLVFPETLISYSNKGWQLAHKGTDEMDYVIPAENIPLVATTDFSTIYHLTTTLAYDSSISINEKTIDHNCTPEEVVSLFGAPDSAWLDDSYGAYASLAFVYSKEDTQFVIKFTGVDNTVNGVDFVGNGRTFDFATAGYHEVDWQLYTSISAAETSNALLWSPYSYHLANADMFREKGGYIDTDDMSIVIGEEVISFPCWAEDITILADEINNWVLTDETLEPTQILLPSVYHDAVTFTGYNNISHATNWIADAKNCVIGYVSLDVTKEDFIIHGVEFFDTTTYSDIVAKWGEPYATYENKVYYAWDRGYLTIEYNNECVTNVILQCFETPEGFSEVL